MAIDSLRPSFTLVDHDNRVVTQADFYGKFSVIFFGFTSCKVICPRALGRLQEALAGLGSDTDRINVLYITVDPERDTPQKMKEFLSERGLPFTGLTGAKEQIDAARQAFHVYAVPKVDGDAPDGYVIPHTAITYVLGPDGHLVDHLNDALSAEEVTRRLREKLASSPGKMNGVPGTRTAGQESLGLLDPKQVASMRHIGNLARQLKGDWSGMMCFPDLGEGFGAYRFQLAYGFYALALAHFHRLPAAPGVFRSTMERMIEKILQPDCWFYWHDVSKGGGAVYFTPRSDGKMNPVEDDNIMYSAYVQTMALLYNSLFDDERYKQPGALTFEYDIMFWGPPDGLKFVYNQDSLNERIYWNMVQNGYLGVACEPYCVFQICNQIPIIGFRLHDVLNGKTHIAEEVTQGYTKAWEEFGGLLGSQGTFNTMVTTHTREPHVIPSPGMDSWCGFLMNAWNSDFIGQHYEKMRDRHRKVYEDGTMALNLLPLDHFPDNRKRVVLDGEFGWLPVWASEMGDEQTLDGVLAYADKYMAPRIQNGGLMYPRNDTIYDDDDHFILSTPVHSNALLPLARLNVKNGLKRLYDSPWGGSNRQHYEEPALTEVDFSVDVYRAVYLVESCRLLFDLAGYEPGARGDVILSRIFDRGTWVLMRDGHKVGWGSNTQLEGSDPGVELRQEGKTLRLGVSAMAIASFVMEWSE